MSRLEPSCPCTRDCAERSALCHTVCERYALYRAQKEADYTNRRRRRGTPPQDTEKQLRGYAGGSTTTGEHRRRNHVSV